MEEKRMTNAEYHAHHAISKSDLDAVHRSPMHYLYRREHPQQQTTPALLAGSVIHKMVLEPETFAEEYIEAPAIDRRTKAGKEEYAAFEQEAAGKIIVPKDMITLSVNIAEAVSHHKTARALLSGGKAETSHFWTDIRTGLECKCRPDYLRSGFCVDLKTTQNASPEAFEKAAYNYRYYVQAHWYLHGLKQCDISDAEDFVFIAVEKEPPYAVAVYFADDLMLSLGEMEARSDLDLLSACIHTGSYHGYEENIQPLSLPKWAAREIM